MKHETRLYGPIGQYPAISAEEFVAAIPTDATEIVVRINSPGGSVADGLAIHNYLRDHKANVTTIVDGFAASAASLVMMAGDVRRVHRGSVVMLHNPWTAAVGNAKELRQAAAALDEIGRAMLAIYTGRTGKTDEEIEEMCDEETFIAGARAVELGLADEISEDVPDDQIAAMVDIFRLVGATRGTKPMESKPQETTAQTAPPPEVAATVTAEPQAIGDIAAAMSEIQARLAAAEDCNAKLQAELTEAHKEAADIKAMLGERDGELAKARAALANPAMADATMRPADVAASITDAEASELDRNATQANKPESILAQYEAMPPGAERQAFLKSNRKAILAEMNTQE